MTTYWELLLLGVAHVKESEHGTESPSKHTTVSGQNKCEGNVVKVEAAISQESVMMQRTREYVKKVSESNQVDKAKTMLFGLITKANLVQPIHTLSLEVNSTKSLENSSMAESVVSSNGKSGNQAVHSADMQTCILPLTDAQDMYLQAAARLFLCLNLDVGDLVGWLPLECIPYLLLSINSNECDDQLRHPFLLYSRFMLRKYLNTCMIPENERELVADCAKFVENAIGSLRIKSAASFKDSTDMDMDADKAFLLDQTVFVMLFELAMYNYIIDMPKIAAGWFSLLWAHYEQQPHASGNIERLIDIKLAKRVEKMCKQACAPVSQTDLFSTSNIITQLHFFERFIENTSDLVSAAIVRSIPLSCRRTIARIFSNRVIQTDAQSTTKSPKSIVVLVHLVCNSLSVLLENNGGDAKAELFPEFMVHFNCPSIMNKHACLTLLDLPSIFIKHPEFTRNKDNDVKLFCQHSQNLFMFLYQNSTIALWCETMESHEFFAQIFVQYPFLKLKRQFLHKTVDRYAVQRSPRSDFQIDQDIFLNEMLFSRIQSSETKYISTLNSVIGKNPVPTCKLIAKSAELFINDGEFDHALSLLQIGFVLVENSSQPPETKLNLERIRRKCYYSMLIESFKIMDESETRKLESDVSVHIITTLETCGLPDRDEFVKLLQTLLQKSSSNALVECTKSFAIYANNKSTLEALIFVIVSRVAAFMVAVLFRITDKSMFSAIYPSSTSPGTDALSDQAIMEVHAFANHMTEWLTTSFGGNDESVKIAYELLLLVITGSSIAQQAFLLLVGCVGGILAPHQPLDKRYSPSNLGPFALCCSPNFQSSASESEKRVAQIISNSSLVAKEASANTSDTQVNPLKKPTLREMQLLEGLMEQVCVCWTKLPKNTSPIPFWVLGDITLFKIRSVTVTPTATPNSAAGPSSTSLKSDQFQLVKRYYLNGIVLVSQDFYRLDLLECIWKSSILHKLIETCIGLDEHIHVAFLSQLLPRVDYKLAYRALRLILWDKPGPLGTTVSEKYSDDVAWKTVKPISASLADTSFMQYTCFWDMQLLEFVVYHLTKHGREDVAQALITRHIKQPEMSIATPDTLGRQTYISKLIQTHLTKMVLDLDCPI
ncbi:Integrator complex subunit 8 [Batrachochytrium dendrobatidis]|nr:Integrator complex subunit 8 [Batrachochytrium dendrobatidis]